MSAARPVHRRLWSAAVVLLVVVTALVLPSARSVAAPTSDAGGGADAAGCTTPPPSGSGLHPSVVQERYGISSLLQAGHDGHGQTAALIEFNEAVDVAALDQFETCNGLGHPAVTQKAMPGSTLPVIPSPCQASGTVTCFNEAQGDANWLVTGAPGLDRIYIIVAQHEQSELAHIVDGLRDGSLTDGRRVDVVSLSFGECRKKWADADVLATEASLQALGDTGTWFFKAAGDAGPSDCSNHPVCDTANKGPDMGYPAGSPFVTAVGGTELLDGPQGEAQVWNVRPLDPNGPDSCSAGAGGLTTFARPAYQQVVPGGAVPAMRGLPDVAALAGRPGYLNLSSSGEWYGDGGTSLASPLYAGALASVRSALLAAGITPPKHLNEALYLLASDPAQYGTVFNDVVKGDNDIYGVGCCQAASGFDLASGLGELHIDQLPGALALLPVTPGDPNAVPLQPAAVPLQAAAAVPATPTYTG
jgi:subtilase family serine protease